MLKWRPKLPWLFPQVWLPFHVFENSNQFLSAWSKDIYPSESIKHAHMYPFKGKSSKTIRWCLHLVHRIKIMTRLKSWQMSKPLIPVLLARVLFNSSLSFQYFTKKQNDRSCRLYASHCSIRVERPRNTCIHDDHREPEWSWSKNHALQKFHFDLPQKDPVFGAVCVCATESAMSHSQQFLL